MNAAVSGTGIAHLLVVDPSPRATMIQERQQRDHNGCRPVGHVVIRFPSGDMAHAAVRALASIAFDKEVVQHLSGDEILGYLDQDATAADTPSTTHHEISQARGQRGLAAHDYHWLVVRARNDGRAFQIADCVRPCGAERAQYFGASRVQELINPDTAVPRAPVASHLDGGNAWRRSSGSAR